MIKLILTGALALAHLAHPANADTDRDERVNRVCDDFGTKAGDMVLAAQAGVPKTETLQALFASHSSEAYNVLMVGIIDFVYGLPEYELQANQFTLAINTAEAVYDACQGWFDKD